MSTDSHDDAELAGLTRLPFVGFLSAFAALLDLSINRLGGYVAAELASTSVALGFIRLGALPRNLAGLSCLLTLFLLIGRYLRSPRFAPIWIRLPIAAFVGVVMPTFTLAVFLPRERVSSYAAYYVLFAMLASNVLAMLFAAASIRYRKTRATELLIFLTSFCALIVLCLTTVRRSISSEFGGSIGWWSRLFGEVGWWLAPLSCVFVLRKLPATRGTKWILGGVFVLYAALLALAFLGRAELSPHYSTIVYGAFRVAMLPEAGSIVYMALAASSVALGLALILAGRDAQQQLGAAILLWVAGAYAPRSPIQLLEMVVAVLLFARAAQALDPQGRARATAAP